MIGILAAGAVVVLAFESTMLSPVEREQEAYRLRQERLRCQAHPDQGCLTQPETENAKAQRDFRERQERIRGCKFDPQGVSCR